MEMNEQHFTASLVPWEELEATCGVGWEEMWTEPPDGEAGQTSLMRCAWVYGHIIFEDGSTNDYDNYRRDYGRRGHVRIWSGPDRPTDEQRRETPWT